MLAAASAANETGAARRRQRRLRQFLRHERLSVAMALAEYNHHAAPRRPTMARARGEESEMNDATGQKTPPPRAASTVHFNLFDEGDVLAARPTPLVEVRPQPGVQRHTAEQVIETFVPVQVLDAPVPQMEGDQVVEFMRMLDAPALDELVIAVPKFYLPPDSSTPATSSTAESRIVGGGADDHILLFFTAADFRAALRHSSSSRSWWMGRSWRPSRFFPGTEFNSGRGAER